MWSQIALKLKETLGVIRNLDQCYTGYQTIMKREKTAVAHESKSGNSPTPVPFEDELEKNRWLDDRLEPVELRDSHGVVSKRRDTADPPQQLRCSHKVAPTTLLKNLIALWKSHSQLHPKALPIQ
ncbi:hypothetical protein HPB49_021384 [Dermacentor silvarum]|uniref:Uncharacterized protein n=1 Tax=Dermacentor silvarum TaxID=543639 RepID=A0ACB8CZL2_DERSI|nr:hypothetical protein HPB49_021384 [Dermacentor silvarum]